MKLESLSGGARNVLLIVLDDLGLDLWSVAPMPAMRRLEEIARVYPTFWAGPVCSNFRARMQTGLRSYRAGNLVGRNLPSPSQPTWSLPTSHGNLLAQNLPGVSTYRGKWHLAGIADYDHPLAAGYLHWSGTMYGGGNYFHWEKIVDGQVSTSDVYATLDVAQDATVDVLSDTNFVVAAFKVPHAPLHEPPPGFHSFGPPWDARKYVFAMLEAWDRIAGRLIDIALARGYIVIVTADNGTDAMLGGRKDTLYEAGLRCPLIVAGAGVVPGASSRLVEGVDLHATIMELRGGTAATRDSFSFARDLFGCSDEPHVVLECDKWDRTGSPPTAQGWQRAVRDERWKLIVLGSAAEEFYDLQHDPLEADDLLIRSLSSEQRDAYQFLRGQIPTL